MSFCIFHAGDNGEIQLQRSIVEISKFLIMYDGKTVSCLRISQYFKDKKIVNVKIMRFVLERYT